jgi:hypothetical protein
VRTEEGLLDLADAKKWVFDGTPDGNVLSSKRSTLTVMFSRNWTDSQTVRTPGNSFRVVNYQ